MGQADSKGRARTTAPLSTITHNHDKTKAGEAFVCGFAVSSILFLLPTFPSLLVMVPLLDSACDTPPQYHGNKRQREERQTHSFIRLLLARPDLPLPDWLVFSLPVSACDLKMVAARQIRSFFFSVALCRVSLLLELRSSFIIIFKSNRASERGQEQVPCLLFFRLLSRHRTAALLADLPPSASSSLCQPSANSS